MSANTWAVVVEAGQDDPRAECINMGQAVDGKLDGWLTVQVAGDHAMSRSLNGSASVSLGKGDKLVRTFYPKGRTPERRKLAMEDVVEEFKQEVWWVESLEAATS